MAKKNKRIDLRTTKQIFDLLQESSESMNVPRNEIIEDAVFLYLTEDSNFINCPKCRARLFRKHRISVGGVVTFNCSCGNTVVWDEEEQVYLKGT
ncbi:hypothetical protein [Niabella aurantiaca]|uniref:hypothetical protein n=1 Tax=Niabella aurantiaca TaxID=379900 RepID=UPI00036B50D5|nr:hypothetical protein [Niabella aurantiaca]